MYSPPAGGGQSAAAHKTLHQVHRLLCFGWLLHTSNGEFQSISKLVPALLKTFFKVSQHQVMISRKTIVQLITG
jgi:hypothetical protein